MGGESFVESVDRVLEGAGTCNKIEIRGLPQMAVVDYQFLSFLKAMTGGIVSAGSKGRLTTATITMNPDNRWPGQGLALFKGWVLEQQGDYEVILT
jgi:hypothetical protein